MEINTVNTKPQTVEECSSRIEAMTRLWLGLYGQLRSLSQDEAQDAYRRMEILENKIKKLKNLRTRLRYAR